MKRIAYGAINGLLGLAHRVWNGHTPAWCDCSEDCLICFYEKTGEHHGDYHA